MGREPAFRTCRRQLWGESGQALVEAAIALPVLLVMVFGVVAAGRVTKAKLAVQASAREASRTLALAPSEQQGMTDALAAGHTVATGYGLADDRLTVQVDANGFVRGGTVTADVGYSVPLADLPLLSFFNVDVHSKHSERVDIYRSRTAVSP